MEMIQLVSQMLGLKEKQVQSVLDLLNEGATIPFIARYRKEQTGSLDEEQIRSIEQAWSYQNNLAERKTSVLNLIAEKGLLTDELKQSIEKALTLAEVEDLYRPFKEKRKTKATEAIAKGLQPLADEILKQEKPAESLGSAEDLEGAGYIIAEMISDNPTLRKDLRAWMEKEAALSSKLKKDAVDEKGTYQNYYEFTSPVRAIKGHQVLAVDRGEKEKVLSVSIDLDNDKAEAMAAKAYIKNNVSREWLNNVIHDAMIRLILPSLKREIRSSLREKAAEQAIARFGDNLEHILMARPLKDKRILAWDPGYGHGCKLAMLNVQGDVLDTMVIMPFRADMNTPRQKDDEKKAAVQVEKWINLYHPDLIVIGNGTASRESEKMVAGMIKNHPGLAYVIGSEIGASVYSASKLAKEEFPDLPVEKRSAISIGRRVQDPLSELVKIDPQSLGVGEYQHDVPQKQLKDMLEFVTDKAVNRVGVNVNTASAALLKHVAGLNKTHINKIIAARQKAPIASREMLQKILPEKAYEQAIGFLRVPLSKDPLDNTGIHPESYQLTRNMLEGNDLALDQLRSDDFKSRLRKVNPSKAARAYGTDVYTMADIIKELINPGLDPRDALDAPVLRTDVLELEDLKPGMELQGTVRNVTSFGAFVDVGLHDDGLVHVSQMSNKFIRNPQEVVHAGQIVTVYVLDTDLKRRRLSLTMVKK